MAGPDARLDHALHTHFHPDHMGIITGSEPLSIHGDYRLRGITEVSELLPIDRLIDRGWPDYDYLPPPASDLMFANYRRFVAENTLAGRLRVIGAKAGSTDQITQVRKPDSEFPFEVRIVAVNDRVWTGKGDETKVRFPRLDSIPLREDWPDENMCSVASGSGTGGLPTSLAATCQAIPYQGRQLGTTRKQTSQKPSARPMCTWSTTTVH